MHIKDVSYTPVPSRHKHTPPPSGIAFTIALLLCTIALLVFVIF